MREIIEGIQSKKKRALARAISLSENQDPRSFGIIDGIFHLTGRAHYVGITGNPGAGKSTVINGLIRGYLARGCSVAVLAVDPSSPKTGGAILGDRIRIDDDLLQERVFFRSVSNRNHLGGLSATTFESLLLLDAFGFDVIFIETVGTGQSETEIAQLAHTVVVVTVPGLGDEIQAEKAGLLEIGDIFVVNKADVSGATRTKSELEAMLHIRHMMSAHQWNPPVLMTRATTSQGINELIEKIQEHQRCLNEYHRQRNYEWAIQQKTKALVWEKIEREIDGFLQDLLEKTCPTEVRKRSHIQLAREYADLFLKTLSKELDRGDRDTG